MRESNVIVIGSGFGGLSAASLLAKNGFDVKVFEKIINDDNSLELVRFNYLKNIFFEVSFIYQPLNISKFIYIIICKI